MKPKIQDVARVAGVSATTVSRVLNDRGYISEETKRKVYQAMKEINYVPNDLARSLYKNRTHLIGVIVPSTSNPFYGELVSHIEGICNRKGYKVLLCNSLNEADKEKKYWEMLLRNQVDGVIVVTYNRGLVNDNHLLPAIAIDHYLGKNIHVISSNNYQGGEIATNELIQSGCKKIIHINGPSQLKTPANDRRYAYEAVLRERGRDPIVYETPSVAFLEENINVIEQLFREHPDVDGIFASDDLLALKIIQYAEGLGYHIPNDLKVIGYDGTELIRSISPQLTTIIQPVLLIAESAVKVLEQQIENKEFSISETVLPIELWKGSTTQ
ncbi:LacI family DNA-binding transcriptional regulator [Gracilibacillus sp. S3-1-1]|uniref:LacI family DNA-binding transcriptional regulator n=1 Tax=Gracilibacillus pellucidus TaxID=3095368 RepID=A0ACC6M3I1_9BACI|nr:LacI family DNA-binding transcriptional regulator [Gracilibacillus sp. S3-1-1]MDX8045297.1 LacI family DNA-binding transcriptional regulator [Gracilibacillus sp. S3-1-1]